MILCRNDPDTEALVDVFEVHRQRVFGAHAAVAHHSAATTAAHPSQQRPVLLADVPGRLTRCSAGYRRGR
jgi:hypothetical protein